MTPIDVRDRLAECMEIIQELTKVAAQYVNLADDVLANEGAREALPGIAHNRDFAWEWGSKGLEMVKCWTAKEGT